MIDKPYHPRGLITHSYLIVSAFGILLTSYLTVSYSESISARVFDDWCNPGTEGVGIHCFSDYYSPIGFTEGGLAWDRGSNYPPLAILISRIFHAFGSNDSRNGLIAFLLSSLLCLMIPVVHLKKSKLVNNSNNLIGMAILLICSVPSLMAFDRGNNVLLLFPLIYFSYINLCREKYYSTALLIALASLVKPQILLLMIVLVIKGKLRPVALSSAMYILTTVLLFLLFPGNIVHNISSFITNLQNYQTYAGMPSLGNYSFANAIGLLFGTFKVLFGFSTVGEVFRPGLTSTTVSALSAAFLILITALLFKTRKQLDSKIQLTIGCLAVILIPGTAFGYYLMFLLIPLLFLEIGTEFQKTENKTSIQHQIYILELNGISKFTLTVFYLMALLPWPFQWGMLNLGVNKVWDNYGIMPTITGVLLWILPLVLFTNTKLKKTDSRNSKIENLK
jgi:hypothetical protein